MLLQGGGERNPERDKDVTSPTACTTVQRTKPGPLGFTSRGVVSTESKGPRRAQVPHAPGHLRSLGQHLLSEKPPRTRHLNLSTGQTAVHDAGKTPPVRDW